MYISTKKITIVLISIIRFVRISFCANTQMV